MKFSISRDTLLKPLSLVAGVVERRQTLPILSNVLIQLNAGQLSLTGTDLEVELVGRVTLEDAPVQEGQVTVPAKKFLDICKSLPDGAVIELSQDEQRVVVRSGRSRFTLSTLPADEFPRVEESPGQQTFVLPQSELRRVIDRTAFAMAQQDVRYYLNGMLWELRPGALRCVATDGHRLALAGTTLQHEAPQVMQVIVPRKGVIEMARLLGQDDQPVSITIGSNHLQAATADYTFTSKLVDGKFPDYERVIPRNSSKLVVGERDALRQAFSRTAILSNEKYRGIRLALSNGQLQVLANNPEQEEAEEVVAVEYQGDTLEIGFNVSYLLDVLGVMDKPQVTLSLSDSNSSALLQMVDQGDSEALYVVMPMRL